MKFPYKNKYYEDPNQIRIKYLHDINVIRYQRNGNNVNVHLMSQSIKVTPAKSR